MKKKEFLLGIFTLISLILIINFASAEIILNQAPNSIYNLGDFISLQVKVTSPTDAGETFRINLLCSGIETEIYKEFLGIPAGEEVIRKPSIPLVKSFIGNSIGTCRVKYSFGNEMKFTDNFELSNKLIVTLSSDKNEFSPEEQVTISGSVTKESSGIVNGIVNAQLIGENNSKIVEVSDSVKDGKFSFSMQVPKNSPAGKYLIRVNVSESDSKGDLTNIGSANYNILIIQVPKSLEIFFEESAVNPEETLRVKAILHDQTGVPIQTNADISIKNSLGKLVEEKLLSTNEFLEYTIPRGTIPSEYSVFASAEELSNERTFSIKTLEKIDTQIINSTLTITNTGNVPYQKEILIKVGETPFSINVDLKVGQSTKYELSAPNGEYDVEIISSGITSKNSNVALTGNAVNVRESGIISNFFNNTLVWIFIILLLAGIGTILYRKRHKKTFFGYETSPNQKKLHKKENNSTSEKTYERTYEKSSMITSNKAELSLSLKGDKQTASIICLKIKNLHSLRAEKTNYNDVLQEIIRLAEEKKASIYENSENIFFIFSPLKTRTFKNERTALNLANNISNAITAYNRLAREKINAGISVSNGIIIAGLDKGILKFMSMGNFINNSKKIASLSDGEVLLNEELRTKLGAEVKTQKRELSGVTTYSVNEVRDDERSKEFIRRFMQRMRD